MPLRIYAQFISSFLMGVISGVFLYVTVYAPEYATDDIATQSTTSALTVEGRMYGGCSRSDSCASFRLLEDGTYNYLASTDAEVEKRTLPKKIARPLFSAIGTEAFFDATESVNPTSCNSYFDGTDFMYEVTLGDNRYTLDTCTTALAYNDELQQLFIDAWQFMQNPTTTYPIILEEGVGGFLRDRFQNSGQ